MEAFSVVDEVGEMIVAKVIAPAGHKPLNMNASILL